VEPSQSGGEVKESLCGVSGFRAGSANDSRSKESNCSLRAWPARGSATAKKSKNREATNGRKGKIPTYVRCLLDDFREDFILEHQNGSTGSVLVILLRVTSGRRSLTGGGE